MSHAVQSKPAKEANPFNSTSDGMTTTESGVSFAGDGASYAWDRRTEADEHHVMESGYRLDAGRSGVAVESHQGGKVLGADGADHTDSRSRSLRAGPDGGGVAGSSSYSDGTTTRTRAGEAAWDKDGPRIGGKTTREIKADDDHIMAEEHDASASAKGVKVGAGSSSRIKDADTGLVHEDKKRTDLAVGPGGVSASRSREDTVHVGDESFTTGSSYGIKDGQASASRSRTHVVRAADGTETSDSRATSVSAGRSGASASRTRERTRADGSTAASEVSGGVDWDKREARVGGSYGIKDKDGADRGTVSGGAKVKVDEHGRPTDASVEGGVSKGNVNVSVKGEYHVSASEPERKGEVWVVEWERSYVGGAAAGGKRGRVGGSVSAEKSHRDFGSRVFHGEKEAAHFSKNAAGLIPTDRSDPNTLAGALALEIGESRGEGDGSKVGASASAKVGVGTVGGGIERSSNDGHIVERISETVFQVTVDKSKAQTLRGQVGVGPASIGGYKGDESSRSRTVRFDLGTGAGRAAFEAFQRDGTLKPGARVVSETEGQKHSHGQVLSLGKWGGASYDSEMSESHTRSEEGTKDAFSGRASQGAWSKIPFLEEKDSMSVALDATEHNDRDRAYALHGSVDSKEGGDSRKHLSQLTGTNWEDEGQKVKSSGKWRVDAEITDEHVDKFLEALGDERVRDISIFESKADRRNELRQALKAAKTSDDRMRALANFVADEGHDGKALRAMRDTIFGRVGSQWGFHSRLAGNFQYDLHLPGDPNFPGVDGRKEIESRIQGYREMMAASPEGAGTLTNSISADIAKLRKRRDAVADPGRYTDLPTELRAQQVGTLDGEIDALTALRRKAALAATKAGTGDLDKDDEEGQDKKSLPTADPTARELASLRKDIARLDRDIASNREAYQMYRDQFGALSKEKMDLAAKRRKAAHKANVAQRTGRSHLDAAGALDKGTDELRAGFIGHLSDPKVALGFGKPLLGMLNGIEGTLAAAVQAISEAVEAWETMEDSEYSDFSMVVAQSGKADQVFFDRDEFRKYDADRKARYQAAEIERKRAEMKNTFSHWTGD